MIAPPNDWRNTMLSREILQALSLNDLKRVWQDAAADCSAKGVQLPNKRKPRVAFLKLVTMEIARRRAN